MRASLRGGMTVALLSIFSLAPQALASDCLTSARATAGELATLARRFLHPGTIKGFNPQPDPPGRPTNPGEAQGFNPQPDPPGRPTNPGEAQGFNPQPDPPGILRPIFQRLAADYAVARQSCAGENAEIDRLMRRMEETLRLLSSADSPESMGRLLRTLASDAEGLARLMDGMEMS